LTAAWLVPAFGTKQGADRILIESHERDHEPAG